MKTLLVVFLAAIQVTHPDWKDAPPSMPKGTKMAVLEGSPREAGVFTIRLKLPAGSRVLPHTHPRPERVTVLSGQVRVGFGKTFTKDGKRFDKGGFYVNPPNEPHYLWIPVASELQLTCEGPWQVDYVAR